MNIFLKKEILFYLSLLTVAICAIFVAVVWPQKEGFYGAILLSALVGLCVAGYIFYAKRYKEQVACPSGGDCNAVVKSKYAQFLGIPLEYMGMTYYAILFILYASFILNPAFRETVLMPIATVLTVGAFLFSIYLLFVQAFLLKKWCIWCLLSAAASTIIFILSLISYGNAQIFLGGIEPLLIAVQSLGYVLGMGGASAAVFLFLKFLDDIDIDIQEADVIRRISEMVWLGLGLILASEFARYIAFPELLVESGTFLIEIVALVIVFIAGAVLMVLCAPFLDVLPFEHKEGVSPLETLRKATLTTGAVALSSWYVAFAMNYIPEYSFMTLAVVYILVVAVGILISSLWQMRLSSQSGK